MYVIIQRLILMYMILRQEIRSRGPGPGSKAFHCFSKFMLISEMLQIDENLNIGDFSIELSFHMKFITASMDLYNMHECAFKSI
jgi:hypothetical protein